MRLDLQIDGHACRHSVLVPINYANAVRPGAVLPVKVDPADPKPLVVDGDAMR